MKLVSMLADAGADDAFTVIDGPRRHSRRDLVAATASGAQRLRAAGLGPGRRVLALLDQDWRGLVFLAAASAVGVKVLMPYNLTRAAAPEWARLITAALPECVVTTREVGESVRAALAAEHVPLLDLSATTGIEGTDPAVLLRESADPVDEFLVLFSSGTTGPAKAICVSEDLVCRRIHAATAQLRFGPAARAFMSGLINNTTGVIFGFGAMLHGSTLVYPPDRRVETWPAAVAAHAATHIMLRPAAMRRFVDTAVADGTDLGCLEVIAYGAAPLPRRLLEQARARTDCQWVQGYGLSETFGPFCWLDETGHAEGRYRAGVYCVGRPDDTVDIRLESTPEYPYPKGEILIRSDRIMRGYYDPAAGLARPLGEWFPTGDIGEWAPSGDLLLKGRIQAAILSENGHRVHPEETEAALATLDGIDEIAVVGLRESDGVTERVVAAIRGPLLSHSATEIRDRVRAGLLGVLSEELWPDLLSPHPDPLPVNVGDKVDRHRIVECLDPTLLIALALPVEANRS
ncbi:class I adenylate-forming enzyme family protein [Nocardia sp. NPDC051570]|uniref:class I adenylate-forming enzyme family protein n=1 Tax=Nocardia sp. NPDC051570 TaxID=3364324 RepID=UPI0037A82C34